MHDAGQAGRQAGTLPSFLSDDRAEERTRTAAECGGRRRREAVSGDSSHANENQMAHLLSLGPPCMPSPLKEEWGVDGE